MFKAFWTKIKQFFSGLVQFLKNTGNQFSVEELLKLGAGALGIILAWVFLFTNDIARDKANFVIWIEGILWGYALGQGISHNVTKQ